MTNYKTRYVDGTPTSEITPVTIWYIRPPHHGHTSQYHGLEWMTHILFVISDSDLETPMVKVMGVVKGQGHIVGPESY